MDQLALPKRASAFGPPIEVERSEWRELVSTQTLESRLWARVDKTEDGCWEWTGARKEGGYGVVSFAGRLHRTHRLSYELAHGAFPSWMLVLHRCDNPPCLRPDHLFLGDYVDNGRDMAAKGRQVFQKHPERAARGERAGNFRIPHAIADAIRSDYASGFTNVSSLARFYGVSRSQTRRFLKEAS